MIDRRLRDLLNEASKGSRPGIWNPVGLCHHCEHRDGHVACPMLDIRTTKWVVYQCRDFRKDGSR